MKETSAILVSEEEVQDCLNVIHLRNLGGPVICFLFRSLA